MPSPSLAAASAESLVPFPAAMQEATTLLQHSNSSEQLPLSLRHALPPLQHGANWEHGEDGLPGARNAARAKLLREVQEIGRAHV